MCTAVALLHASAACSGGTEFTNTPVPCSNPATTEILGVISTYQWNGERSDASDGAEAGEGGEGDGAVCTTRLYGGSAIHVSRRPSTSRTAWPMAAACACVA